MPKTAAIKNKPNQAPTGLDLKVTHDRTHIYVKVAWGYSAASTKKTNSAAIKNAYLQIIADTNRDPNKVQDVTFTSYTDSKYKKAYKTVKKLTAKKAKSRNGKLGKDDASKLKKAQKVLNTKEAKKDKKSQTLQEVVSGYSSDFLVNQKLTGLAKSHGATVDLNNYHPTNDGVYLQSIVVRVQGSNKKSTAKGDKWDNGVPYASKQVVFYPPKTPVIEGGDGNYNKQSRKLTMVCTCSDPDSESDAGKYPIFDVLYDFTVQKYKFDNVISTPVNVKGKQSTELSFNMEFRFMTADTYINLDECYRVTMQATARGCNGNTKCNPTTFHFGYPGNKKITSIDVSEELCLIHVDNDGYQPHRRTDFMWLERLYSFVPPTRYIFSDDDKWAELADADTAWEKCGEDFSGDNALFTRMYRLDKQGYNSPYARTYYRVVTKNYVFEADPYYSYSSPVPLPGFHNVPSARTETVDFLECVPEANGTSVRIVLAYKVTTTPQGEANSDGCQVSWSEDPHAWESNNPPGTFDMPDFDILGVPKFQVDPSTLKDENGNSDPDAQWLVPRSWKGVDIEQGPGGSTTDKYSRQVDNLKNKYTNTSRCYISGLNDGGKYYFKALRYLEEHDDLPRTEGKLTDYTANLAYEEPGSTPKLVETSTIPKNIKVKVKDAIPLGNDLEVVWTFEGDSTQTAWQLLWYTPSSVILDDKATSDSDTVLINGKLVKANVYKVLENNTGTLLKEGKDSAGYTVIPFSSIYNDDGTLKEQGLSDYLVDGDIYIAVRTKTTGDFGTSSPVKVHYVDDPDVAIGYPAIVTAQPFDVTVGTNAPVNDLVIKIKAADTSSEQRPDGMSNQPEGTIVYSKKYTSSEIGWRPDNELEGPETDVESWHEFNGYEFDTANVYRTYSYNGTFTGMEEDFPIESVSSLDSGSSTAVKVWVVSEETLSEAIKQVDIDSDGYYSSNPSQLGWYEKVGSSEEFGYILSDDTEIQENSAKIYYTCGTWSTTLPSELPEGSAYYYAYRYEVTVQEATTLEKTAYMWTAPQADTLLASIPSEYRSEAIALYRSTISLGYFSNFRIPRGIDLRNHSVYELSVVAKDPETKLDSQLINSEGYLAPLTKTFTVEYERESFAPRRNSVYIFSDPVSLSSKITLNRPALQPEGDVCDIYRVTPDGAEKVMGDVSYGQTVVDSYAPYSTSRTSYSNPKEKAVATRYRVVNKTPDGLLAWDDYLYNLEHIAIRFDWGDPKENRWGYNHLEIPYNLNYSDAFKKYFEGRLHMGQKKPSGYWSVGIDRTSKIQTDIIKYDDPRDKEALRALASYSGPVMVRRPDGCAYLANVDVDNISNDYSQPVVQVSFTITEIELVESFMMERGQYLNEEDARYLSSIDALPGDFQTRKRYSLKM